MKGEYKSVMEKDVPAYNKQIEGNGLAPLKTTGAPPPPAPQRGRFGGLMFVDAIETAIRFTRPIHFISRNYGSETVIPGTATLFFVNAQGWAFTCRHVVQQLVSAGPRLETVRRASARSWRRFRVRNRETTPQGPGAQVRIFGASHRRTPSGVRQLRRGKSECRCLSTSDDRHGTPSLSRL